MTPPVFTPSGTFVPFGRDDIEQSIASRFEQQVRRHPDRLAVRTAQDTWTYEVLNRRANRIAHALLERDRNGRTPIALLVEQGAPLIAAILAVFKAGKILVGLDPAHPPARLAGFVDEAQTTSVVTSEPHLKTARHLFGDHTPVVDVDRLAPGLSDTNPGVASAPEDIGDDPLHLGLDRAPEGRALRPSQLDPQHPELHQHVPGERRGSTHGPVAGHFSGDQEHAARGAERRVDVPLRREARRSGRDRPDARRVDHGDGPGGLALPLVRRRAHGERYVPGASPGPSG